MGIKKTCIKLKKLRGDLEFRVFRFFLKRFCQRELDQWTMFKQETTYGPVYMMFSRAPILGESDVYIELP